MPFIPDIHTVLSTFKIIGPDCRLSECSCSVVTEIIDSKSDLSEVSRCIGIELIESNFCNSGSKHMSDIPPWEDHGWESKHKEKFDHG